MSSLSASDLSVSEPVVRVENLSLTYRTTFERRPTLKQAVRRMGRRNRAVREIHAVKDVSFDVEQGTVLGIIGNNGAGKSTLMRAIAGIMPPTEGRVMVRGRVSTLLALGVGFNANLSGRENVILGGLAAGYTRDEIEAKYDEIAAFTELGDFLDLPMRAYSSGMFSRLAFSVAVHMDPDILLVDEALSAGDAHFKAKAAEKMNELVASARTMFLVSHALGAIKDMCSDAIWLHQGQVVRRGAPDDVIAAYTRFVKVGDEALTLEDL